MISCVKHLLTLGVRLLWDDQVLLAWSRLNRAAYSCKLGGSSTQEDSRHIFLKALSSLRGSSCRCKASPSQEVRAWRIKVMHCKGSLIDKSGLSRRGSTSPTDSRRILARMIATASSTVLLLLCRCSSNLLRVLCCMLCSLGVVYCTWEGSGTLIMQKVRGYPKRLLMRSGIPFGILLSRGSGAFFLLIQGRLRGILKELLIRIELIRGLCTIPNNSSTVFILSALRMLDYYIILLEEVVHPVWGIFWGSLQLNRCLLLVSPTLGLLRSWHRYIWVRCYQDNGALRVAFTTTTTNGGRHDLLLRIRGVASHCLIRGGESTADFGWRADAFVVVMARDYCSR